jgi:hypothetical protein
MTAPDPLAALPPILARKLANLAHTNPQLFTQLTGGKKL